jgi:hypothetical protein
LVHEGGGADEHGIVRKHSIYLKDLDLYLGDLPK